MENLYYQVMSCFSIQFLSCWTSLSFTLFFASEIVREVGFEAAPDPRPSLRFPAHGIKGVPETQKPRRKRVFFPPFLYRIDTFLSECL